MKPYFDPHSAGALLLIVLLAWLSMEAIQFVRQWRWRASAARIGRRSFWLGFGAGRNGPARRGAPLKP